MGSTWDRLRRVWWTYEGTADDFGTKTEAPGRDLHSHGSDCGDCHGSATQLAAHDRDGRSGGRSSDLRRTTGGVQGSGYECPDTSCERGLAGSRIWIGRVTPAGKRLRTAADL